MKYKLLNEQIEDIKAGVHHTDLYQMLAYAIGRKSTQIHLIYPCIFEHIQAPVIIKIEEGLNSQTIFIHVHQLSILLPDTAEFTQKSIAEGLLPRLKEELSKILYG